MSLTEGDLRLTGQIGNGDRSEGILEVFHSGTWGTVCDDSFTDKSAMVACQQMGYQ